MAAGSGLAICHTSQRKPLKMHGTLRTNRGETLASCAGNTRTRQCRAAHAARSVAISTFGSRLFSSRDFSSRLFSSRRDVDLCDLGGPKPLSRHRSSTTLGPLVSPSCSWQQPTVAGERTADGLLHLAARGLPRGSPHRCGQGVVATAVDRGAAALPCECATPLYDQATRHVASPLLVHRIPAPLVFGKREPR